MSQSLTSKVANRLNQKTEIPNNPFSPSSDPDFLEEGLNTSTFGPIPTGPGLGLKDGTVQVDTQTMEGTLDSGVIS